MTDIKQENLQAEPNEMPGEEEKLEHLDPVHEEDPQKAPGNFIREASYFLLFIGAVFIISAMETGSYRTPWPVAIVTTLAGLGLLGYSWYLGSRSKS